VADIVERQAASMAVVVFTVAAASTAAAVFTAAAEGMVEADTGKAT
jgi:hypothetical protein